MNYKQIKQRVKNGDVLAGAWMVLGSGLTAEIAGRAGFDWLLLDLEHGMGDLESALQQLHAIEATPAVPIVRVAFNEDYLIKRVLDLGPLGVMVPMVNDADDARRVVSAMRYPPQGIRGVSPLNRPANFALDFKEYFRTANEELLTVVQIESARAVENAEAIAAVDGVDVLFIGPMDLSINMGIMGEFGENPKFIAACEKVLGACRKAGKASGILLLGPGQLDKAVSDGFTFLALGSDGGQLAMGMKQLADHFEPYRSGSGKH